MCENNNSHRYLRLFFVDQLISICSLRTAVLSVFMQRAALSLNSHDQTFPCHQPYVTIKASRRKHATGLTKDELFFAYISSSTMLLVRQLKQRTKTHSVRLLRFLHQTTRSPVSFKHTAVINVIQNFAKKRPHYGAFITL